jgi:hypothetical protein
MKQFAIALASVGLLMAASIVAEANSLDVNASAAITGSNGLEVTVDDTTPTYLVSAHPDQEAAVRVEFNIDVNSLDLGNTEKVRILRLMSSDAGGHAGPILTVFLKKNDTGTGFFIGVWAKSSAMEFWNFVGRFWLAAQGGAEAPHKITVEWEQADPGVQNGTCTVYKDDVQKIQKTNIWSAMYDVNAAHFGVFNVEASTKSGSFYLDDYVMTRLP